MIIYVVERKYNCVHQYGATLTKERALERIEELEKHCAERVGILTIIRALVAFILKNIRFQLIILQILIDKLK